MENNNKSKLNCILKSKKEVLEASKNLNSLGLPAHPDLAKSWDTWKIVNFIKSNGINESKILDVGCKFSPILPYLRILGFKNLYGCDVDLALTKQKIFRTKLSNLVKKDSRNLLVEMLENKDNFYHLSVQNLENTNFESNMFDFISSLSVIEHGVDIKNYFCEMNKILKRGGYLLTSTDYWPEKIKTNSNVYQSPKIDIIFDRKDIDNLLDIAQKNGFELFEPIDFEFNERVVNWKKTGKEYTFMFFCLKKR